MRLQYLFCLLIFAIGAYGQPPTFNVTTIAVTQLSLASRSVSTPVVPVFGGGNWRALPSGRAAVTF